MAVAYSRGLKLLSYVGKLGREAMSHSRPISSKHNPSSHSPYGQYDTGSCKQYQGSIEDMVLKDYLRNTFPLNFLLPATGNSYRERDLKFWCLAGTYLNKLPTFSHECSMTKALKVKFNIKHKGFIIL